MTKLRKIIHGISLQSFDRIFSAKAKYKLFNPSDKSDGNDGLPRKKICTLGTLWQNNNFNSFGIDLCICGKKNPSLNFRFFAFAFFQ